jgi:hypothetical protein
MPRNPKEAQVRPTTNHRVGVGMCATAFAVLSFVGSAAAQQTPRIPVLSRLVPWGIFSSIQSSHATATVSPVTVPRSAVVVAQPAPTIPTSPSQTIKKITFEIPRLGDGQERPVSGQSVSLSLDGATAGFVVFPITIPRASGCVGKGGVTHGCFKMTTTDLTVSNTGIVSGKTTTVSNDDLQGFTGGASVLLLDEAGNVQEVVEAGCWGVSVGQTRTDVWHKNVALDAVLRTRKIQLFHYHHAPCGRKAAAFFRDLKTAGDALGPWTTVAAAVMGG